MSPNTHWNRRCFATVELGEPTSILQIHATKAFPIRQMPEMLRNFAGFTELRLQKHAVFRNALFASMALEDLLVNSDVSASFKPFNDLNANAELAADGSGVYLKVSNLPCSDDLEGGPVGQDARVPSLSWGRRGVIAALVNFFARFEGFCKISFRLDSVLFVHFTNAACAARAVLRTTSMKAMQVATCPQDNSLFGLEPPSLDVFLRLDPPGFSIDEAQGLMETWDVQEIIPTGERGCVARFADIDMATKAVQWIRSSTNLVSNFSRIRVSRPTYNNISSEADHHVSEKSSPAQQPVPSTAAGSNLARKWPAIRASKLPSGLNVRELFAREPGFLCLLFEPDAGRVAIYEDEGKAEAAKLSLSRLLASGLETCSRVMPKKLFEPSSMDPTSTLKIKFGESIGSEEVLAIVKNHEGFVSISLAKKALEDMITTTDLSVSFGSETSQLESGHVEAATPAAIAGPKQPRLRKNPSVPTMSKNGAAEASEPREVPKQNLYGALPRGATASPAPQAGKSFLGINATKEERADPPAKKSPHVMRGSAKRTLHVNNPPSNLLAFKDYCIRQLGAEKTVFKRYPVDEKTNPRGKGGRKLGDPHSLVVFPTTADAERSGPMIMGKWSYAIVDFAIKDWIDREKSKANATPNRTLYIVTSGNFTKSELHSLLNEYKGFEELEFGALHSRGYFATVEQATSAMEDLVKTTGMNVTYSNVTSGGDEPAKDQSGETKEHSDGDGSGTPQKGRPRSASFGGVGSAKNVNGTKKAGNGEAKKASGETEERVEGKGASGAVENGGIGMIAAAVEHEVK
ncbi:hypothetical protein HK101_001614 [Irineochytrium annulatum]|nr:hypothetical protein HK101_001614 [Irineochytrium annulatum]